MSETSFVPEFGDKLADQFYIQRPGAYAVIQDSRRSIAVLSVGTAFFLPGGGSIRDETPERTLHREIMEECGRKIQITAELGAAVEYLHAQKEQAYYQIYSTFFLARFLAWEEKPVEADHLLVWLSASEAIQHLHRKSQAWAVQIAAHSED